MAATCSTNYCLNDGLCIVDPVTSIESCSCKYGFSGVHCEIRPIILTPCKENVCDNGGICVEDPSFKSTLCMYNSNHISQLFENAAQSIRSCEAKDRSDAEVSASNLRMYTIIGIILGCCALVGIVGLAAVKFRNSRKKRKSLSRQKTSEDVEQHKEHIVYELREQTRSRKKRTSDPVTQTTPPVYKLSSHRSAEALIQRASLDSPAFHSRYSSERKGRHPERLNTGGTPRGRMWEHKPKEDRNGGRVDLQLTPRSERSIRLADLTEKLLGQPSLQQKVRQASKEQPELGNETPKVEVNGNIGESDSEKHALLYPES